MHPKSFSQIYTKCLLVSFILIVTNKNNLYECENLVGR